MRNFFKKKSFHLQTLFRLRKTFLLIQLAFLVSAFVFSEQGFLGLVYSNERSVQKSDEEAVKWFKRKRASDQGFSQAQSNLGLMYAESRGVPQSDEKAAE